MFDTSGNTIIQRRIDAAEREAVVRTLQDAWWDCAAAFRQDMVDVRDLGLSVESLRAMSADLAAGGRRVAAAAVARAAAPVRPVGEPSGVDRRARHGHGPRAPRVACQQGRAAG